MTPIAKHAVRAAGYFLVTIVSGMVVYDSPPESLAQFWQWAWQPFWNGLLAAFMSLGINQAVKGPPPH